MIKKSFISVKKNSTKKNSAHGGGQPTACGHIRPESPVLGFAIVVEKLLSSFSRWMWNGGHQAWHKSPVTFLQQVRESEPPRRCGRGRWRFFFVLRSVAIQTCGREHSGSFFLFPCLYLQLLGLLCFRCQGALHFGIFFELQTSS